MNPLNILVSGFGLYGAYRANTSQAVALRLDGTRDPSGTFSFRSTIYPADIPPPEVNRGEELLALAADLEAVAVIGLGMSSVRHSLTVEMHSRNLVNHPEYCTPEQNFTRVDPMREIGNPGTIDAHPWNLHDFPERSEKAGFPLPIISFEMSSFCCNHLMYQAYWARIRQKRGYEIPFIFLHLPCIPEAVADLEAFTASGKVTMTVDQIIGNIMLLLEHAHLPAMANPASLD